MMFSKTAVFWEGEIIGVNGFWAKILGIETNRRGKGSGDYRGVGKGREKGKKRPRFPLQKLTSLS